MVKLTDEELKILERQFQVVSFPNACKLVYEHHIPHSAFALLEGQMTIFKRSREVEKVPLGTMVGLFQLYYNQEAKAGCEISSGSKVIIITRSDIQDAVKLRTSPVYAIIDKILNLT